MIAMSQPGFVHLLTSYWGHQDPARRDEILSCLQHNRTNPRIARVHLFTECDAEPPREEHRGDGVTLVPHAGNPSFASLFEYASRHLAGEVVAIANADIHFDESLELLRDRNLDGQVLALTRHNVAPYLSWSGHCWERNYGSQDVWIFRAPLPPFTTEAMLGWFGCETLLARDLQRAGVRVTNPSADIKAWHVHAQRERVRDLFAHPRSHWPGNVDPGTWHGVGFRCLPIEPLGKWKVYTVYSETHDTLFRQWFLGTMQDNFEVIARRIDQTCPAGSFMSEGWTSAVSQKIPLILEAIDAHTENGFFIFSDADVQWFGPVEGRIRRLLAENPQVDIFFQADASKHGGGIGNVCTGFFVCKGNIRTRAFWTLVGERMRWHGKGDQAAAQEIIRSNVIRGLQVGYLPDQFWGPGTGEARPLRWQPGMFLDPPTDLLVHHANWTVGVRQKIAQLEYIARKRRLETTRGTLAGKPDPDQIDHWAETCGPNFRSAPATSHLAPERWPGDPLLQAVQIPQRLPGTFWGLSMMPPAGDSAGSDRWRTFVLSARSQGLKFLVIDQSGQGRPRMEADLADIIVPVSPAMPGAACDRAAILAVALSELPADCDKLAWLETPVSLEDNWLAKAVSLLERYEEVPLRKAGGTDMPGQETAVEGVRFKEVVFGPEEIRQDLALPQASGLAWAARRKALEVAKFAEPLT